ncbi:hypothetical protein Forpe1208_v007596 [Fusarium oxysporum f. sp. rapae]|uniref:Uncharacterized protein n=1 Tax=Fusarium oxysporum f. sp. rapae TaxID=485398 RepID=A0A8J5NWX6_FUSOX|nr:hypothetical protein Forpe1208_v007596 [Fusarium oxysporum f. sp. rapae]
MECQLSSEGHMSYSYRQSIEWLEQMSTVAWTMHQQRYNPPRPYHQTSREATLPTPHQIDSIQLHMYPPPKIAAF